MEKIIYFHYTANDKDNGVARDVLATLPAIEIENVLMPESIRDLYRCPYIRGTYGFISGLRNITFFVQKELT